MTLATVKIRPDYRATAVLSMRRRSSLFISQPSLSETIRELETEAGF